MVQDFAKIRPEPILEKRAIESPPAWSLLCTGLVTGMAIGVFGCFLFYLSGNLPPLPGQQPTVAVNSEPVERAVAAAQVQESEPVDEPVEETAEGLTLEFYEELPNYEVYVDATPVEIDEADPELELTTTPQPRSGGYMLQAGAFQQPESADRQKARLEGLGLQAVIKRQGVPGGTLLLVQTGPFQTSQQISDAESLLRRNNIASLRIRLD